VLVDAPRLLFDEECELPGRNRLKLQASNSAARIMNGTLLLLRLRFGSMISSFKNGNKATR
jgi:hypothetical protein